MPSAAAVVAVTLADRPGANRRPSVAAWEGLQLAGSSSSGGAVPGPSLCSSPWLSGRVFRAGADEHDRRAEVPHGNVDGVAGQAELFDRGGLGLGHGADNNTSAASFREDARSLRGVGPVPR